MAVEDESEETFIKNKSTKFLKNEGEDGSSKYTTEAALNLEINRATSAENSLDTKIDNETKRAIDAEKILEAKLNENIIKNPDDTYIILLASNFPDDTIRNFKILDPEVTIDWGDGTSNGYTTDNIPEHHYLDNIDYHLIKIHTNSFNICENAFAECNNIISVYLGNHVASVGNSAFKKCLGLSKVVMPKDPVYQFTLGTSVFARCTKLESVELNSITELPKESFSYCSKLKNIDLSNIVTLGTFALQVTDLRSATLFKVVTIGASTFYNCPKLKEVVIGSACTTMSIMSLPYGPYAGLAKIKMLGSTPPDLSVATTSTFQRKSVIVVPRSAIDTYKSAPGWIKIAKNIVYEIYSSDLDKAITDLDADNIAYKNKQNTFTEIQKVENAGVNSRILLDPDGSIQLATYAGVVNLSTQHVQHNGNTFTYPDKDGTLALVEDIKALNIENGSGENSLKQKPDGDTFQGQKIGVSDTDTLVEFTTDASGINSTILGGKNNAQAKRATAIGGYNVAAGASSLATGEQTITEGRCSFTTGQRTRAKGGSSFASGGYSLALGDFSMTQGYQTKASGRSAMATGAGTSAEGDAALSGGTGTKAIGDASVAFGNATQSKGNYSASFGSSTEANGVNSIAMGDRSVANAASSKVEGINNIANNSAYVAPTPGGGGGSVEPVPPSTFNVEEHYGEGSHVEGAYNSAYGFASHAEGLKVSARGHYSHAEGTSTISSGESSHAEGGNTQASGKWSHAEGDNSIASNSGSHAEGKSQATGGYSHSEGSETKAIGQGSHSEGRTTQAKGDFSHAEGVSSVSSGLGSHAEGNSTASDEYAHSEGEGTLASGKNSHAQNRWTKAVGDNSTAIGISTTATGQNSFAGGNGSEAVKNGSFVHGFGLKSN